MEMTGAGIGADIAVQLQNNPSAYLPPATYSGQFYGNATSPSAGPGAAFIQVNAQNQCAALSTGSCNTPVSTESSYNILASGHEVRETVNAHITITQSGKSIPMQAVYVYRLIPPVQAGAPATVDLLSSASPQMADVQNGGADYASCNGSVGCGTVVGAATPAPRSFSGVQACQTSYGSTSSSPVCVMQTAPPTVSNSATYGTSQ